MGSGQRVLNKIPVERNRKPKKLDYTGVRQMETNVRLEKTDVLRRWKARDLRPKETPGVAEREPKKNPPKKK